MSDINVSAPRFQTRIDTDFGHSPVGNLGGRSVRQEGANPPRIGGGEPRGFLETIKDLASRLLDMVTPEGVRVEQKVRRGLEAMSGEVGNLLGALSKTGDHKVDGIEAKKILDGLAQVAEPVTSRGASFDDVFKARVEVHLRNMTPEQLVALRDGVALTAESALKGDPRLEAIAGAVRAELGSRTLEAGIRDMLPVFQSAIGQVAREADHPGAMSYVYNTLYGVAARLLDQHGYDTKDHGAYKDLQRALVREALDRLVEDGTLRVEDAGAMVKALPTKELHALMHTKATIGGEGAFITDRLLMGAIGLRAEELERGFLESSGKVLSSKEPARDFPGFCKEVVTAAKQLAALRTHAEVHDLKFDEKVDEAAAKLHQHLEEMLKPSNLRLGELDDQSLQALSSALKDLGIDRGTSQVVTEVARRKEASIAAYTQALHAACEAAARGDITGLLRAMAEAQDKASEALLTHQRLGEKIDDTDKIMQFRETLMGKALAGLDVERLGGVFGFLNSPEGKALSSGIAEAAYGLLPSARDMDGLDPALGKRMFDAGTDLQMLGLCVNDALKAQGVSLPPLPDTTTYGMEDIGARGREALRELYGVEIGEGGTVNLMIGVAGPGFQKTFEGNLKEIETTPDSPSQDQPLVSDALWHDLGRASYSIRSEDGSSVPLLDRESWNLLDSETQVARKLAAVDQLRNLVNGDDRLLMLVSKVSNQSLLAGIQKALMGPESPVRLPDGTPGRLMGPERISYNIASDGNGGIVVRCDYSVNGATHFLDPAGGPRMVELDPSESRCHFTMEVTIGQDGRMQVSDPVQYLYEAKPLG